MIRDLTYINGQRVILETPMQCSRMQGILALGEVRWSAVLTYRETATWGEQVVIDSAGDWQRESQNIAFFQYLIGLTDEETDNLFLFASTIVA
jgi:hypothetical protein